MSGGCKRVLHDLYVHKTSRTQTGIQQQQQKMSCQRVNGLSALVSTTHTRCTHTRCTQVGSHTHTHTMYTGRFTHTHTYDVHTHTHTTHTYIHSERLPSFLIDYYWFNLVVGEVRTVLVGRFCTYVGRFTGTMNARQTCWQHSTTSIGILMIPLPSLECMKEVKKGSIITVGMNYD